MGSIIGYRIDYNGVGARRGQRYIPSENLTKYPPGLLFPLQLISEKFSQLRWLHTVSHQFQQTNIHNFFDDFQDIALHFTRKKLQKQLA